ncbi:hypothetical protein CVV65_14605 [Kyrpidia spormannii]|uniref:Uncharacterized protein n=1 Tax=Kyrpidia spormannii TaxID=2055160 RepID=A0A2K8NA66_9BACL|nr:hypothetical protein [Kyrpidia spormannii]ATY86005.1 hypothetical protein CVV65_14605 [Kyrpidia spormannii]
MKNTKAFFILLILQFFYFLFLIPWSAIFFVSGMMFDAPGSENNILLLAIFFAIMVYPVALISSSVMSWKWYKKGHFRRSYIWNSIPLIWIIPILLVLVLALIFANFT